MSIMFYSQQLQVETKYSSRWNDPFLDEKYFMVTDLVNDVARKDCIHFFRIFQPKKYFLPLAGRLTFFGLTEDRLPGNAQFEKWKLWGLMCLGKMYAWMLYFESMRGGYDTEAYKKERTMTERSIEWSDQ